MAKTTTAAPKAVATTKTARYVPTFKVVQEQRGKEVELTTASFGKNKIATIIIDGSTKQALRFIGEPTGKANAGDVLFNAEDVISQFKLPRNLLAAAQENAANTIDGEAYVGGKFFNHLYQHALYIGVIEKSKALTAIESFRAKNKMSIKDAMFKIINFGVQATPVAAAAEPIAK